MDPRPTPRGHHLAVLGITQSHHPRSLSADYHPHLAVLRLPTLPLLHSLCQSPSHITIRVFILPNAQDTTVATHIHLHLTIYCGKQPRGVPVDVGFLMLLLPHKTVEDMQDMGYRLILAHPIECLAMRRTNQAQAQAATRARCRVNRRTAHPAPLLQCPPELKTAPRSSHQYMTGITLTIVVSIQTGPIKNLGNTIPPFPGLQARKLIPRSPLREIMCPVQLSLCCPLRKQHRTMVTLDLRETAQIHPTSDI